MVTEEIKSADSKDVLINGFKMLTIKFDLYTSHEFIDTVCIPSTALNLNFSTQSKFFHSNSDSLLRRLFIYL